MRTDCELSDQELMLAYQRGDDHAFATLVARHERPLWSFLRRFVREDAVASDLLQDLFLRVVDSSDEWQPRAKVSTWMYTIARNLCTDHARRMQHRQTVSLDAPVSGNTEESGPLLVERTADGRNDHHGEHRTMDRQLAQRIEDAVEALPLEQREVFLMRELSELSFSEIAVAVGASEPTVKSRMRYALLRLREALAEVAPERVVGGVR